MLTDAFTKLKHIRIVELLRAYFRSPFHPAVIALFMVVSELFSLELPVFYFYFVAGVLALLFEDDTLALVPIIACCYMTISSRNNPGKLSETVFGDPAFMIQMFIILAVSAGLLITRFVSCLITKPKQRGIPGLTVGFSVLGVAFLLGGAFGGAYGGRTVLFGFAQIVAWALPYFYFIFTVDWNRVPKHYLMSVFLTVGMGVAVETLGMYALPGVITEDGVVRTAMFTGWGIYNNVGGVMAMCIPAPFYFASLGRKESWLYSVLGILFFVAVVLSQSRTAMLFGFVVTLACTAVVLWKTQGFERVKHVIVYGVFLLACVILVFAFREKLETLFHSLIEVGVSSYGRINIWRACMEKFAEHPLFGVGFYETPGGLLHDGGIHDLAPCPPDVFLPPRAHNTVCQLMASGGIVAVGAYVVHRAETVLTFTVRPSLEKTFAALCVASLLLTSLLDCHLFNFGPALLYSILLAFAEGENRRGGLKGLPLFRRRKN